MINFWSRAVALNSLFSLKFNNPENPIESNTISSFMHTVSLWYLPANMAGYKLVVVNRYLAAYAGRHAGVGFPPFGKTIYH